MDVLIEVESDVSIGKRRLHSSTSTTQIVWSVYFDK